MDFLLDAFDENSSLILAGPVFVIVTALAFAGMAMMHKRGAIRRRTAGLVYDRLEGSSQGHGLLRKSSFTAAQSLIDDATRHYSSVDSDNMKLPRQRFVQAGIFNPRAVGFFFLLRIMLAVGLAAAIFILLPLLTDGGGGSLFWAYIGFGGLAGYVGPSLILDRMIAKRRAEYRAGFPDFMDLLVVCADAGLAMEGALERVGRELGVSYPLLAANIHMTNLEIRAGRTLTDALEHFGDRLGLDEVRSFAMLIAQSAEFGSPITDALRVYSENMRHRRLSIAEEKAYALPAKLSVPLMVCIFPVLFVVILLPVVVRVKMGAF